MHILVVVVADDAHVVYASMCVEWTDIVGLESLHVYTALHTYTHSYTHTHTHAHVHTYTHDCTCTYIIQ